MCGGLDVKKLKNKKKFYMVTIQPIHLEEFGKIDLTSGSKDAIVALN